MSESTTVANTGKFIHDFIKDDLQGDYGRLITRFPPEPNGYLHIGHAKSICFNFEVAKHYGGKTNLRFDDTNPVKEDVEYVDSIKEDILWLGYDWEDRLFFASDYFEEMYNCAISLIEQGKAFVCELTAAEIRDYRGSLNEAGKESPYRNRPVEESLDLFKRMRGGEFPNASKTLRAKIDMSSPNINMRDPVIYRIAHESHHRTGDAWCIYPMYDFAHPLEDAFEKITHSLCSIEFENHRPLYNWFVENLDFEIKPRQIEFAKLTMTNTIMGKRYIKNLVDTNEVDGWDDPRLCTLSGMRRRGYTPKSIRMFCDSIGMSKAINRVDIAQLEYFVREDLKDISKSVMAVSDPLKVVITNYDSEIEEVLEIENHHQDESMGTREVLFGREIYIDKNDFMENPPKKFFRLFLGNEVRLKGAYFIKCNDIIKDENGNVIELHCTYDKETKSGSGFTGRKVKGTIHWVSAKSSVKCTTRVFDYLVFDDENEEFGVRKNPNSLTVFENSYVEKSLENVALEDRFQFIRDGYYCLDSKLSKEGALVFNQIVGLKSSYQPNNN